MNRRGLVMAKKRFTKSALWNDQTTDHPQQTRTSFPFKRSGRTDVWPLPAERLQQDAFKPLREKSPYPRSTGQAFKPLFHDASENCRRRRLREEADFAGGSEIFQSFFVMNRIVRLWHFFRRFFCFQVVLRRSILIPRRLGEHALQS